MPAAEGPTGAVLADGNRQQLRFTRPPQGTPAPGSQSAQTETAGMAGEALLHGQRTVSKFMRIQRWCTAACLHSCPALCHQQAITRPAGGQKPSPVASAADSAPSAAGPPEPAGSGQASGELGWAHADTCITLSCPVGVDMPHIVVLCTALEPFLGAHVIPPPMALQALGGQAHQGKGPVPAVPTLKPTSGCWHHFCLWMCAWSGVACWRWALFTGELLMQA